jgi:hypothetical protein
MNGAVGQYETSNSKAEEPNAEKKESSGKKSALEAKGQCVECL